LSIEELFLQAGPLPPWLTAVFISLLSAICHDYGRFEEALRFGRQAEAIFKRYHRRYMDDFYGALVDRTRLFSAARTHQMLGLANLSSGLDGLLAVRNDFARVGCPTGVGITHYFGGRLLASHGRLAKALDCLLSQEAEILRCSIWGKIAFFSATGGLLLKNGKVQEACPILQQALAQLKESGIRPVSDPYSDILPLDRPHVLLGVQDAPYLERGSLSMSRTELEQAVQRTVERQ
jgi:hypothetical protein